MSDVITLPIPSLGRIHRATYSSGVLVEFEYTEPKGVTEQLVKDVVRTYLLGQGYSVRPTTKFQKGPDLEAFAPSKETLLIEAKGEGSRPEMFNNFFLYALGQILLRMDRPDMTYIIALPWHAKFVSLVRKVPKRVRQGLSLEFWLVVPTSGVIDYQIGVLTPDAE